jgi:hypothetical protein
VPDTNIPIGGINQPSADPSPDVVQDEHLALFEKMREATGAIDDEQHRARVHDALSALEASAGHPTFTEKHRNLIEVAADQLTVLAPYLPALTRLL